MESADVFLGLHDFLERMRKPSAADFVKSIKSFIVSISNNAPDIEKDSAAVQEFFTTMEAAFKAHPLWSGCSEEELDNAGEGLEKYIMTKLFTRVFASNPEESKCDEQLFQKMALVQQFISPENLDIKPAFQNETSWLLAQKELQKINMYKAPRDKLVCILNCCKVINNLLFNAAVASDENAPGADEFLPVLIYVTIKANPPQLHSNLLYIQRYRRQSKLVGEVAYFFTNMLSAESFISNIDAKSISMDEAEFEKNMELSRALLSGLGSQSSQIDQSTAHLPPDEPTVSKTQTLNSKKEKDLRQSQSSDNLSGNKEVTNPNNPIPIKKAESLPDLENKGAALLLKDNQASKVFQDYPYVFVTVGDLTISDVEDLLNNYKQLVLKYVCLSKGLSGATTSSEPSIFSPLQVSFSPDTYKEFEDQVSSSDVKIKRDVEERDFGRDLQYEGESVMHKHPHEHASVKVPDAKEGRANPKVIRPENSVADSKFLQADNEENAEFENSKSSLAENKEASSKHSSVADKDEQSEISDDPSK